MFLMYWRRLTMTIGVSKLHYLDIPSQNRNGLVTLPSALLPNFLTLLASHASNWTALLFEDEDGGAG